jgi:protein-disulfide isomerase
MSDIDRGPPAWKAAQETMMVRLRGFLAGVAAFAAVAGLAMLARPSLAQDAGAFKAEQKAAIEQIVKDYIMAHPEIVQDALLELDKRQKEAETAAVRGALKSEAKAIYDPAGGVVVGNPQGDVTIVEFFDYNCPYCRKSMTTLDALIKGDPKLKVLLRDLPIVHPPESVEAAKLALAARNQLSPEKFWEFHKRLFSASRIVARPQTLQVAKDMGLDLGRLERDAESDATRMALADSDRLSQRLNLRGTPAFVIGGEVVFGAQEDEDMKAQIAAVRQCGKATC